MVFRNAFEAWPAEAGWMGQVTVPTQASSSRRLFTAFTEDAKPRVVCPAGKDSCYCAEGHKCVQSWPQGPQAQGADYVDYIDGCPAGEQGMAWISRGHYNKNNPLCADDKCVCVLENEPNADAPEFVMAPPIKGNWSTLKNRYEMPKCLTDKFVNAVRSGEEYKVGGAKEPVWLTGEDWVKQYPDVKANMNRVMRTVHRKVMAIESMMEEPKAPEDDVKLDPSLGPEAPKAPIPKMSPAQTAEAEAGERAAKLLMTEFRMFQQMCKRLQASAQALGEANDGEGGLNCFDDYKEKTRLEDAEKAIQLMSQTASASQAEFIGTLKMAPNDAATRNVLVVAGLIRDMGPNESDAFWLPRPQNAPPPVIPGAPKPAQAEEESDDHAVDPSEGTSAQSMAFDVKAAAAMTGWASRPAPRRPSRNPRQACSKRTAEGSVFL